MKQSDKVPPAAPRTVRVREDHYVWLSTAKLYRRTSIQALVDQAVGEFIARQAQNCPDAT